MLPGTPHTFVGSTTFAVTGMSGPRCEDAVRAAITAVAGVEDVRVLDPEGGIVAVTAVTPVDRVDIETAVRSAGFALVP